jgi:hypothetical protein
LSYKPFSPELYADNDNAKDLVINFLELNGFKAWVNPDQYGIDVIFHDETFVYQYCEVEVKHSWRGSVFPFDTVHFPKRKLKFANTDSIFAMLNHERTHVLLIPGKAFLEAPVVRKDTIYTKNEEFIEIKVNNYKIHSITEAVNE